MTELENDGKVCVVMSGRVCHADLPVTSSLTLS